MRKTKYDDFIFYDPTRDELFLVNWDYSFGGVDQWYFEGNDCPKKLPAGKFKDVIPNHWVLIDRLPERTMEET